MKPHVILSAGVILSEAKDLSEIRFFGLRPQNDKGVSS